MDNKFIDIKYIEIHVDWVIAWIVVILYLTLTPSSPDPDAWLSQIPQIDKIAHFGMFFILGWLGEMNVKGGTSIRLNRRKVIVIGIFLGLLTEIAQHWIPNRNGDFLDLLFDLLGLTLGIIFTFPWKKIE